MSDESETEVQPSTYLCVSTEDRVIEIDVEGSPDETSEDVSEEARKQYNHILDSTPSEDGEHDVVGFE